MYVTRRLLRSTMPPDSMATTSKKEEKKKRNNKKEVPFLPPPTPKRRAAVRASAKIGEAVTDYSSLRGRAAKQMKDEGDKKKDIGRQTKTMKKKKEIKNDNGTLKSDAALAASLHGYQLMVDVHYRGEQYTEARILDLDPEKKLLYVHYMGWNARFDAWVPLEVVKAHGSHCDVVKKKNVSWDGDVPLFATEDEVATKRQNRKTKASGMKKRGTLSPKACQAARRGLQSASSERQRHDDDVKDNTQAKSRAQRTVRKSFKNAKVARKAMGKPPRSENGKKVSAKTASTPSRRTPRRVQVAVGTIDEDSERKNDSETADMVLHVEIEGRAASNDEVEQEGEGQSEEEGDPQPDRAKKRKTNKGKSRRKSDSDSPGISKRKRDSKQNDVVVVGTETRRSPAPKKRKNAHADTSIAAVETAPSPPHSGRGGLGSATREKLAAVFRLRVQQRQQMEQLNVGEVSFEQSLHDQAVEIATVTASDTPKTKRTKSNSDSMANVEVAAAEEYQRQLQQYYYHQQMMLANSLTMGVAGSEDPSTIPLQGGIMDPRIIQERLTALEERRRQQAHVQAYYHQLMLTRERNVRALAANQAFMASSAAVWERQLRETQSEDGTSSVTSWKDVTAADSSEADKTLPVDGVATADSDAGENSKDDSENTKECETSLVAPVATDNDMTKSTSPDAVKKTAADSGSTETLPTKSIPSSKCNPADTPTENVLYEFVL